MKVSILTMSAIVAATLSPGGVRAAEIDVDPRGPIVVSGVVPRIVEGGVEATGYKPSPELKATPKWSASWVWLSPQADTVKTPVACFRKQITMSEAPSRVTAWVSADWRYRLYVNGNLVARGPADPGADYPGKLNGQTGLYFADYCDLTPYFHKGANAIAVEVFRDRLSAWWGSSGSRGLFFQAEATLKDKSVVPIRSDESWRGQAGEYLQGGLKYVAAKEPVGWRLAGFDDAAWPQCVGAGDHWPKLWPSELPQTLEIAYPALRAVRVSPGLEVPAKPFQNGSGVTLNADGAFTLQYDRVLSGYAGLKVKGGAGATLTIDFAESNGGGRHAASMLLGDGVQYFETPYYDSFAFLNVKVTGVKTPVEIQNIKAVFSAQPVAYKGRFACSDDALNRLWTACRWQTHICMQDRYLDSPDHQEPISDPGDYLIESLVNYYTFHEPALTRQDSRKFAAILVNTDYVNFHTSYALLWLQMLLDYYDFTGDAATLRELAPQVHGLLDKFTGWRGKTGLISQAPDYMFMDWVDIGGFGAHHPPAVIGQGYMTAFYYRALLDARRLSQITGDAPRAATYDKLRGEVAEAYNRELWNDEKGLYRDGKPFVTSVKPSQWLPADKDIETFSAQNNSLAVLYDLAPKAKQADIMARVMAAKPNCQPYFMHFTLGALAHAGLFDSLGAQQMRRWKIEPDTQTFHEMWNSGDLSHGWGGTPLIQMSARILGVSPLTPTFSTMEIRPTLCDLKWANGRVPTPHGNVDVSWKLTATGMTLDVKIPSGTSADVTLPVARFVNPKVTLKGRAVPNGHAAKLPAGNHQFVLTGQLIELPAEEAPTVSANVVSLSATPHATAKTADDASAFEKDVAKDDLIALSANSSLLRVDEHAAHTGGGTNADALRNGTALNGAGDAATADDGKTFRGYGDGDWLTFYFDITRSKTGFDITKIATIAAHNDNRASQHYTVSIALAGAPDKFVPLSTSLAIQCNGGASQIIVANATGGPLDNGKGVRASGVVAVRFDFKSGENGFNVYREIDIAGKPTLP